MIYRTCSGCGKRTGIAPGLAVDACPRCGQRFGRLVFGEAQTTPHIADGAPAWTPVTEAQREANFRRWARGRSD